jgi:uncharacterized protein YndB with AHSA1/START domain/DNA-binding transcriptional ArsR family regulator
MARAATTADAFNAVAEPRRREILDVLSEGERPVNDLVRHLRLTQPQVSKHLRVLREVGAVDVRTDGRQRLYRLNGHALKPIHDWVRTYERLWSDRFDQLDVVLDGLKRQEEDEMRMASSGTATLTLPTDEQILITREFDAPKHLVYKAFTTPELVRRWWHARRGTMSVAEIDLRVGGKWRYVMVTDDGMEVGFHGEYREIVPNERVVSTEVYEGLPEGVTEDQGATVNTATFGEVDGRTTLTLLIEATSKESRDAIIESGMEAGLQDALDLLEQTAKSLR